VKTFTLPDLGEGLQEAQLVQWHVKPGDQVHVDQPLLSVETAKAIVEIPAPYSGQVVRLFGAPGDTILTGAPLVCIDTGAPDDDAGTVVGRVEAAPTRLPATAPAVSPGSSGPRALPSVRLLARQLNVDLATVAPSGAGGIISAADVRAAAARMAAAPAGMLSGTQRSMAQAMMLARQEVAAATIVEDADIDAWPPHTDTTVRLIRALVAGCIAEPGLNAWYDSSSMSTRLIASIDVGVAIDTPHGLLVAVLRNAADLGPDQLRESLAKLHAGALARTIRPEDLRGHSITLSNFGTIGGRYAVPIVVPPTVAILGAGRARKQVVAFDDTVRAHRVLPLSLTFDHRAVAGAAAARFLVAVIRDLERNGNA
jgi:pyruvate dehydrogenase E2 component (dihydrolipoamide acetyltransferase)